MLVYDKYYFYDKEHPHNYYIQSILIIDIYKQINISVYYTKQILDTWIVLDLFIENTEGLEIQYSTLNS